MSGGSIYVPPQRIGIKDLVDAEALRSRTVAEQALAAFALDGYEVASLTKHSNVTARLVSPGAPSLALRLRQAPGVDVRTELEWLRAVRRGTSVRVVETYAEAAADTVRRVTGPNGETVECTLFLWADGQPLAAHLTETNYRELGRLSAALHEFGARWKPPEGLKPLLWNQTMYYEGSRLQVVDPQYRAFISTSEARIVKEVVAAADAELSQLAREAHGIYLHGNIEMWNVLTTGPGELRLLDFEDVMHGDPVLDIAITLYYGRERNDYRALSSAYEEGYRSVRPWPVRDSRQLDILTAARATMLLNHALQTESDKQSVTERLLPLILAAAL